MRGREFGAKPVGSWSGVPGVNDRGANGAGCRPWRSSLGIFARGQFGAPAFRCAVPRYFGPRSCSVGFQISAAHAVEAVNVRTDAAAIDLTDAVEFQHTEGDRIQVSTAPGPDGIIRRIEVRAREAGKNWAVFALANNGDEQIDRLIVAPHYRMVGSGLIWPDLGAPRMVYITPSSGDPPERQDNANADVFRVTLDPGTVITFVAELRTENLPQLYCGSPMPTRTRSIR